MAAKGFEGGLGMSRPSKLDRNGIPIIDVPPEQKNKLPKCCQPGMHEFRPVGKPRLMHYDDLDDISLTRIEYRCRVCGTRDFQDEIRLGGSWS